MQKYLRFWHLTAKMCPMSRVLAKNNTLNIIAFAENLSARLLKRRQYPFWLWFFIFIFFHFPLDFRSAIYHFMYVLYGLHIPLSKINI
jgi:hypothetical protein